jgi:hypothetical protein
MVLKNNQTVKISILPLSLNSVNQFEIIIGLIGGNGWCMNLWRHTSDNLKFQQLAKSSSTFTA